MVNVLPPASVANKFGRGCDKSSLVNVLPSASVANSSLGLVGDVISQA